MNSSLLSAGVPQNMSCRSSDSARSAALMVLVGVYLGLPTRSGYCTAATAPGYDGAPCSASTAPATSGAAARASPGSSEHADLGMVAVCAPEAFVAGDEWALECFGQCDVGGVVG